MPLSVFSDDPPIRFFQHNAHVMPHPKALPYRGPGLHQYYRVGIPTDPLYGDTSTTMVTGDGGVFPNPCIPAKEGDITGMLIIAGAALAILYVLRK